VVTEVRDRTKPEEPAEAMAAAIALRRVADQMEREAVDRALELGWSWAQIAQALGVTRQAAHQRHASRGRRQARLTKGNR